MTAPKRRYAGLLVSLAKQEEPDLASYDAPEMTWRLAKKHHVGLVVTSPKLERVDALVAEYRDGFYRDFFATAPPRMTATE